MLNKQNRTVVNGGTSPAEDGHPRREKGEETPSSYYYDDATGYEIYEDEDDAQPDEEADSAEDELQT